MFSRSKAFFPPSREADEQAGCVICAERVPVVIPSWQSGLKVSSHGQSGHKIGPVGKELRSYGLTRLLSHTLVHTLDFW